MHNQKESAADTTDDSTEPKKDVDDSTGPKKDEDEGEMVSAYSCMHSKVRIVCVKTQSFVHNQKEIATYDSTEPKKDDDDEGEMVSAYSCIVRYV